MIATRLAQSTLGRRNLGKDSLERFVEESWQFQAGLDYFDALLLREARQNDLAHTLLGYLPVRHFDQLVKLVSQANGRSLSQLA